MSSPPAAFVSRIHGIVQAQGLITHGGRVIVGLSGGADSVALLRILHEAGYRCIALHANFMLRNAEAERDEQFCRRLCEKLAVPIEVVKTDTRQYASERGQSIEMAAREIRYNAFAQAMQRHKAEAVAVAHHKEDNAETLLLNLIRGTGIKGLAGMSLRNEANVVRPLLSVSKAELLDFLAAIGQDYMTDSTNLTPDVKRNKIRLEVIPLLREINPSVVDTLCQTATRMNEAYRLYSQGLAAACADLSTPMPDGSLHIVIRKLLESPTATTILHYLLSPHGFTAGQMADIMRDARGQSGAAYHSPTHTLLRESGLLKLYPTLTAPPTPIYIDLPPIGQSTTISLWQGRGTLTFTRMPIQALTAIDRSPHTATLDAAKLSSPLQVRPPLPGERFTPFGMKGSKTISDFLTDLKLPLREKQNHPIVCDAQGKAAWIAGHRISRLHQVDESTNEVVVIRIEYRNV